MRRRIGLAARSVATTAMLVSTLVANVSMATAASTVPQGRGPAPGVEPDIGATPLTPEQRRIAGAKLAIARQEIAHPGYADSLAARQGGAQTQACPFTPATIGGSRYLPTAVQPNAFCSGYYGAITTYPRKQETAYWCGPATVQVMSNYAWGMSGTSNKYSQAYIAANFTHTTTAGTNTPQMIAGLRAAVAGHNPSDFIYDGVYHNNRLTGPLSGSEWHGYVRTDLSVTYKMPQAVSVSPMDPSLDFGLSTWTAVHAPQQNAGHWITIYAWSGVWDGSPIYLSPAISYDDSGVSPGVQGTDPAANIYTMIKTWNPNHGTDGVVW